MNISAVLVTENTLKTNQAEVIASDISPEEFRKLAQDMGFTIYKKDQTLLGYYFCHPNGDSLVSFPSFFKKGTISYLDLK